MDITKVVKKEIDALLEVMKIDASYSMSTEEVEGSTYVTVAFDGENLGYLIGNHGKHLDSLQYIAQMLVRKQLEEDADFRLILDVCGYRQERNDKLERFALQKADDARILGEFIDLPPMKPFDRRVIHMTLQQFDDITTESHGEDRDRYVRIIPKSDFDENILNEEAEESEE